MCVARRKRLTAAGREGKYVVRVQCTLHLSVRSAELAFQGAFVSGGRKCMSGGGGGRGGKENSMQNLPH